MTTLLVDHVSKSIHNPKLGTRYLALNDVSFNVLSGTVLAIVGPSGSGKTTLLKLIAGLIEPDSGRVLYNTHDLRHIPREQRNIGMVFQDRALMPKWSNRQNIGFYLDIRQREEELPQKLSDISSITGFDLETLLDRRPTQISGGEQQRVAIARALARDLRILLLDEPFGNLDMQSRTRARIELRKMLTKHPLTTVYVTHEQTEAVALADRIAVLREGKIEQIGTYHQLYHTPLNLFVASFIGERPINLFPGHVHDGKWYGENFGGYTIRSGLPEGHRVTLGIRPEHVNVASSGTLGVVDQITPHFTERIQVIEVWLQSERWRVTAPIDEELALGSTIQCRIDEDHIMYFDTDSGARIG